MVRAVILGMGCLLSLGLAGKTPTLTQAELAEFQKKMLSVKSLQVGVDHKRYLSFRKRTVEKAGSASFRKPNQFRWQVADDILIFDGKSLFKVEQDHGKATEYSGLSGELKALVEIVLSFDGLTKNYSIETSPAPKTKEPKTEALVVLVPKDSADDLEKIELRLDLKRNFVSEITLNYKGGNRTTFAFKNPEFDKVAAGEFKLPGKIKITKAW